MIRCVRLFSAALLWTGLALTIAGVCPTGVLAEPNSVSCADCHEDVMKRKVGHYPAVDGLCDMCHVVDKRHFDEGNSQYVTKNYAAAETCFLCHNPPGEGKKHHSAMSGTRECSACHDPHGSNFRLYFRVAPEKLCFECHSFELEKASSAHHFSSDGTSCLGCHNAHASDLGKLLKQKPQDICLGCHSQEIQTADRVIPDIAAKLKLSGSVHAPALENCTSCHVAHASKFGSLLEANYPDEPLAAYKRGGAGEPNTYAMCFKCHDQKLLSRNAQDTRFRLDGVPGVVYGPGAERAYYNLHAYHVVNAEWRSSRGRSCSVCHDAHGSMQDHLIRPQMPRNELPLTFESVKDSRGEEIGGNCAVSCHKPVSYRNIIQK